MKIYALMCEKLVLYVGKTTRTLEERARKHRSRGNETHSKYIPEWMGWEIKLLEEVTDEQGTAKEQYYYDTLKPWYNKCRPGQTTKEGNKVRRNTEYYKQYQKQYRDTDEYRAKCAEWQRQHRAAKKATQ